MVADDAREQERARESERERERAREGVSVNNKFFYWNQ